MCAHQPHCSSMLPDYEAIFPYKMFCYWSDDHCSSYLAIPWELLLLLFQISNFQKT